MDLNISIMLWNCLGQYTVLTTVLFFDKLISLRDETLWAFKRGAGFRSKLDAFGVVSFDFHIATDLRFKS